VLLTCQSFSVPAQSVIPDSLRVALRGFADDSIKVKKIISATAYLPFTQADSAIFYADSIIRFAERIAYPYGTASGYSLKAEAYIYKGDYLRALHFAQQALHLREVLNDKFGIAGSHSQLASLFRETGNYKRAIAEIHRSREMLYSLGTNYYDRATDKTKSSELWKLSADHDLAKLYLAANILDSALFLAKRVLKMAQVLNHNWSAPPVLLGDIYYMKNDYQSALKSYGIKTTFNFDVDSAKNFLGKALVFAKTQEEDSCILYARNALDMCQRIKFSKGAMQASEILSKVYEKRNPEEAIRYYKISTALKDSLYSSEKVNQFSSLIFNDELRKLDVKAAEESARNKYRIWSLLGIMFTLLITGILLWINNQHKKTANILLQQQKQAVEKTLQRLQSAQTQLIQSEKMASLGELTAGIAHEIQNPLNFVNNFSEVSKELLNEMSDEIEKGNLAAAKAIHADVQNNLEKILHHGKRADGIVKGMLQHSRSSSGAKEPTDINGLADEYLRLAFHGFRAKDKSFNVSTKTDFDSNVGKISVVPQDIGRVVLNLITNAFYAVSEKKKHSGPGYEPMVTLRTKRNADRILISVIDNGEGIPQKVLDKIFQPFFTTKPTGEGTGLGLSISYDIVKAHRGELRVETSTGCGSEFTIELPG
jgi:two-component system NtrC family sensor kinase